MKKSDRCLEELRQLVKISGISPALGQIAREEALENWIHRWVYELDHEQSYIKTSFSDDEKKVLNDYTINVIAENLMQECVDIEDSKKKLKLKVRALRANI